MTYRGKVSGGVVVLEGDACLPEGTEVEVHPQEMSDPMGESLPDMADLARPTGIADLAENLDHYLYGHPKVTDAD